MDKFFIQNAFKTLDEIEEEMNKQKSLNESLNETKAKPEGDKISSYNDGLKLAKVYNKPVIYGYSNNRLQGKFFKLDDPIVCDDIVKCERDFRNKYKNCSVVYVAYPDKEFVEQESLNEDLTLDLDELADKYIGLTCNINNEESDYNNEIGTIKSLVDYEGDFSNSVWEIVLNTGVSLNVLGNDLEVNLQEKLPKDLAKAYSNAPTIFRKSVDKTNSNRELHYPSEFFPKSMQRRGVTIDFENSNYKEISKEEALKYSKAPLRSKLRVLFNHAYGAPRLMMWDENNTPITKPQDFEYFMDYGESPYSFKNIIKHADKIYVTDEDEHKIVRDKSMNQDDYLKFLDYTKGLTSWGPNAASSMELKAYNDRQSEYNNRSNDIDDTGNHGTSYRNTYNSYRYKTLLRRQKEYEDKLKELSGKTLTTTETEYLNSLRRLLKDSQINYLKSLNSIRQAIEPNRLKPLINTTLADLIILKYALKKEQKNFQKAENNDTADLRYHKYVELTEELKRLEDKLKTIQTRIDEVKSELTPELKQEYEELQEEKLFSIGDKFQEILNELNKLRKDSGLKVDESLKEELDCETHLRIYTQNESGYEDFIDGPTPNSEWSSEEEALTKAKELAQDADYEHVCLVKIKYCPEINDEEVTILFDSYELEESLNEEKINIDYVVSLFGDDSHYYKEEDYDDIPLSPDISGATKFNKKKDISILDIVKDVCEYSLKYMPEDEVASLFDLDTVEEVYEKDEDYFISSGLVKIITVYKNKKINLPESLNEDTNKDTRSIGEIVDDILGTKNESLNESKSFNLKDESDIIDATAYKEVGKETPEQLVVVDPSIESKDDDLQPHAGDAILQCRECKTIIFQRTEDLVQDGDTDIYNKDMPCPHCGAHSGFNYLYQAADKNSIVTEKEEEIIETPEPGENEEDTSLPPVESDFISLDDIDNIQEESFERLVNPYLVKLYENIKEFKTTNVTQEGLNGFKITGKLIGNTGKEKLVEFLFTIKENNATSIVLEGYNKLLTEDLKAYNFKAKIKNKELIFESFSYKYNKNIDGKDTLIEGIEE